MKKYEVQFAGYKYPFKVLAYSIQHAESKVQNFLKRPQKAVKVSLAKCQKIYAGHLFPAA